jgi:tripartite-type tricarboxylate transporter receptor subunit TctC
MQKIVCAFLLSISCLAVSADYPARPIRMVVPFGPGSITDILARTVSSRLSESVKQQVVVDNRPGANGIIGGEVVARSIADGYTIMLGAAGIYSVNQSLYAKMPYDPLTAFAPVTQNSTFAHVLIVNPSLPVKSIKDLIAYAKGNPGKLTFAGCGAGGTIHLAGELFKSMAAVDMVHISYKLCPQAYIDLIGGQTQLMFDGMPTALPQVKAGKMRALAVTVSKRSQLLPELPTIAEAGLPGYEVFGWNGFAAPAGTPQEVVAKLNHEIARILRLAEVKDYLLSLGAEPVGNSPEEFGQLMKSEAAKWGKLLKSIGLRLD